MGWFTVSIRFATGTALRTKRLYPLLADNHLLCCLLASERSYQTLVAHQKIPILISTDLYLRHPSPAARPTKIPLKERLLPLSAHENIYTLPNFLTATRLVAAPVIGYLVLHDYHTLALSLFVYAGVTDLVDGWIARKWKLQTVVGTVIDPMADKTLMTVLTVCLAIKGLLPGEHS